jgi:hypothetical protein
VQHIKAANRRFDAQFPTSLNLAPGFRSAWNEQKPALRGRIEKQSITGTIRPGKTAFCGVLGG